MISSKLGIQRINIVVKGLGQSNMKKQLYDLVVKGQGHSDVIHRPHSTIF